MASFLSLNSSQGSHVVYALQKTRRYKVISIDNLHNAHPKSLARVSQIAKDALPADASEADRDSAEVDNHICDLTKPEEIVKVFEQYGKGGIWGVVHIAVRVSTTPPCKCVPTYVRHTKLLGSPQKFL